MPPAEAGRLIADRVHSLPRTDDLLALHAQARDGAAVQAEFVRSSRRIMRLQLEASLGRRCHRTLTVTTPIGGEFAGRRRVQSQLFAVSVSRAGDTLDAELRDLRPGTRFGKILIQRDPLSRRPPLHHTEPPRDIAGQEVLLLGPHPQVRVVTSFVDERSTAEAFMYPGIGDFGDHFHGTSA